MGADRKATNARSGSKKLNVPGTRPDGAEPLLGCTGKGHTCPGNMPLAVAMHKEQIGDPARCRVCDLKFKIAPGMEGLVENSKYTTKKSKEKTGTKEDEIKN